MSLFSKFFNTSDESPSENFSAFIDLTDSSQLDTISELSETKPQIIFKHSTRCGVSRMVFNTFKKENPLQGNQADVYYLDLIAHRDISNEIAQRFKVNHESPQLLVIKNGNVVAHESHGSINDMKLDTYV